MKQRIVYLCTYEDIIFSDTTGDYTDVNHFFLNFDYVKKAIDVCKKYKITLYVKTQTQVLNEETLIWENTGTPIIEEY